jgi:hypothetical protein
MLAPIAVPTAAPTAFAFSCCVFPVAEDEAGVEAEDRDAGALVSGGFGNGESSVGFGRFGSTAAGFGVSVGLSGFGNGAVFVTAGPCGHESTNWQG